MRTTVHVVQTDGQSDGGVAVENNPGLLQTTRVGRSETVKAQPVLAGLEGENVSVQNKSGDNLDCTQIALSEDILFYFTTKSRGAFHTPPMPECDV